MAAYTNVQKLSVSQLASDLIYLKRQELYLMSIFYIQVNQAIYNFLILTSK